MCTQEEHFDDPGLRSAVKRVYGDAQVAPAELRQRLMATLRQGGGSEQADSSPMRIAGAGGEKQQLRGGWSIWNNSVLRAAAVLLMAIGVAFYAFSTGRKAQPAIIGMADVLAMIATHDKSMAQSAELTLASGRGDFQNVGRAAGQKLHFAVLTPDLVDDGWEFRGGDVCRVGATPAAQLVFGRGGQRISVFSLPASACPSAKEGAVFGQCINDHMVSGFVRNGGVYGMIGYCGKRRLPLSEVCSLMERHADQLVTPAASPTLAMEAAGLAFLLR